MNSPLFVSVCLGLLVLGVIAYITYIFCDFLNRFGSWSKFKLVLKHSCGEVDVFLIAIRKGRKGDIVSLEDEVRRLGFAFVDQIDIDSLSCDKHLPAGVTIATLVKPGKAVLIHTDARVAGEHRVPHEQEFLSRLPLNEDRHFYYAVIERCYVRTGEAPKKLCSVSG